MSNADLSSFPTPEVNQAIGGRLTHLLDEKGIDRLAFSQDLDIPPDTLRAYEDGSERIAPTLLSLMSAKLDVGIEVFFDATVDLPVHSMRVTEQERNLILHFRKFSGVGRDMMLAALATGSDRLDDLIGPMRDVWISSIRQKRKDRSDRGE